MGIADLIALKPTLLKRKTPNSTNIWVFFQNRAWRKVVHRLIE